MSNLEHFLEFKMAAAAILDFHNYYIFYLDSVQTRVMAHFRILECGEQYLVIICEL